MGRVTQVQACLAMPPQVVRGPCVAYGGASLVAAMKQRSTGAVAVAKAMPPLPKACLELPRPHDMGTEFVRQVLSESLKVINNNNNNNKNNNVLEGL